MKISDLIAAVFDTLKIFSSLITLLLGLSVGLSILRVVMEIVKNITDPVLDDFENSKQPVQPPTRGEKLRHTLLSLQSLDELWRKARKARARAGVTEEELNLLLALRKDFLRHDGGHFRND